MPTTSRDSHSLKRRLQEWLLGGPPSRPSSRRRHMRYWNRSWHLREPSGCGSLRPVWNKHLNPAFTGRALPLSSDARGLGAHRYTHWGRTQPTESRDMGGEQPGSEGQRDLGTVLPWHEGGPEAGGPNSTRLFLQLHRAEVALGLLQRDPARRYLGSGAGKG